LPASQRNRGIASRLDLGSPLDTARHLAQARPDVRLVVVDGSGHTGSDTMSVVDGSGHTGSDTMCKEILAVLDAFADR
jgi:proline iminopeptidase